MGSAAVSFSNLPSHASKPSTKRLHQPHPDSGCCLSFTLVASTRYASAGGINHWAVLSVLGGIVILAHWRPTKSFPASTNGGTSNGCCRTMLLGQFTVVPLNVWVSV
jgi:hypothetical protein